MATLRKVTPHTWEGELGGYHVFVSDIGGWHCHVITPLPKQYTVAVRDAKSFAEAAAKARAWIEANPLPG